MTEAQENSKVLHRDIGLISLPVFMVEHDDQMPDGVYNGQPWHYRLVESYVLMPIPNVQWLQ